MRQEILATQIRLLYANSNLSVGITIIATTVLAAFQWSLIPHVVDEGWWLYMVSVSVSRYVLAWHYHRAPEESRRVPLWGNWFVIGAGLAGIGWSGAAVFLYRQTDLTNQVFLVFVLGGMMLGAAFLLAPRPEAFSVFLVPTGIATTARLFLEGDQTHLAMGSLVAVFTLATLITTARIYRSIDSVLRLQYENRGLLEDLRTTKGQTDELNRALELRVQERTAELYRSNEKLQAEIQQRMQMEEEVLRARKLESLGVLAGGIAHDFNNFLTIIQGNIELAKAALNPREPVRAMLERSANACQRAAFLSSQLLTFAKGGSPVRCVISAAQLVTDAVQLARAGNTTTIQVSLADDLWNVEVDPGQMGQVLHNILLNARQSMPDGGIIEVSAENVIIKDASVAERVRISIRDYGCGIPADALPRIFDPYFTTKPGGTGLGLATAHAIVTKHGGHISAGSKPGAGTVVTVDLPVSHQSSNSESQSSSPIQRGTERILVMDDEQDLRELLQTILSELGYDVRSARDGAEAVALYEQAKASGKRFDAVILDLTVSGGMGGLEAAVKLKETDPSVKLIVSSGYSDAPVMSHSAQYGFDAVIAKPWTLSEVTRVIRTVLVAHHDLGPQRSL